MLLLLLACQATADPVVVSTAAAPTDPDAANVGADVEASTVRAAFPLPAGTSRVDGGAFGEWLGAMTVRPADVTVRTHDGRTVGHDARVIELPLVKGDLQQCADSAIRLRAEWLKATGGEIMYHSTSGDPMPWSRYAGGETPYAAGNDLAWRPGGDKSWDGYLRSVFMYAGTRSLALDTEAVDAPIPGDIVVVPGGPGHAVVLLDVAKRGDETLVLVGEGFMPAQDFHVELGPVDGWWAWDDGVELDHWTLPASGLRRWSR